MADIGKPIRKIRVVPERVSPRPAPEPRPERAPVRPIRRPEPAAPKR